MHVNHMPKPEQHDLDDAIAHHYARQLDVSLRPAQLDPWATARWAAHVSGRPDPHPPERPIPVPVDPLAPVQLDIPSLRTTL